MKRAFGRFFQVWPWRSIKTRVTLFTLGIFVIGIWSLAFYASRMLSEDMQRMLSEQQFSTVSMLAAHINEELNDRLQALETIAKRVTPAMLAQPAALQALLEQWPVFQSFLEQRMLSATIFLTLLVGAHTGKIMSDATKSARILIIEDNDAHARLAVMAL